ncbi:MAG: hypothetical protein WD512_02535 [Candidatus Paceibacterota bacterium]
MSWDLNNSFTKATSYLISGKSKDDLLNQLSNNNRAILSLSKTWTSDDIIIEECYIKFGMFFCHQSSSLGDKLYIWLTNDVRRKFLKNSRLAVYE